MKSCPLCKSDNDDNTGNCHKCGMALLVQSAETAYVLKAWMKCGLYFAAWGVVVVATLAHKPADLLTAPEFPIGLLGVLPGETMTVAAWFAGPFVIGIGWIVYGVLTYIMKTTRKTGMFFLVYIVFCILLALNVVGCKAVLNTVGGIH
jgi:hypothetical protein